ncbi:MAG: helix-turn-helix transcriptional regulator [Tissierellia bacterium]|nr:helix-turn-helix transcriptional regulator [Tissierellia bacterium]
MNFGEKLKNLRDKHNLTQQDLAKKLNVSLRTITNYETGGMRPKSRDIYYKMSEIFDINVNYLLTEEEDFIFKAKDKFGNKGKSDAEEILRSVIGLFAGGKLDEEDKKAVFEAIQEAYFISKLENKKYSKKD